MSKISEELERLHKKIDSATGALTLMIVRRKYRVAVLSELADELEECVKEIREFVNDK